MPVVTAAGFARVLREQDDLDPVTAGTWDDEAERMVVAFMVKHSFTVDGVVCMPCPDEFLPFYDSGEVVAR